jgi:hypothetical protein
VLFGAKFFFLMTSCTNVTLNSYPRVTLKDRKTTALELESEQLVTIETLTILFALLRHDKSRSPILLSRTPIDAGTESNNL